MAGPVSRDRWSESEIAQRANLRELLATPKPLRFHCEYTINLQVTDPWGQPAGLPPFQMSGNESFRRRSSATH
jgi:hypothetical protein